MGTVKYLEDNNEAISNRLERPFVSTDFKAENAIVRTKIEHIKYKCNYCQMIFDYEKELFIHVRKCHNDKKPIIVINDIIPGDTEEFFVDRINEVLVYVNNGTCKISIDDNDFIRTNGKHDITNQIYRVLHSKNAVSLKVNDVTLRIIKKSMDAIRNPNIDIIISEWDSLTEAGKSINLCLMDSYNFAERQYLEAFFDYYTACLSNPNDKKHRYYDTFTKLKSFISLDSRALLVMKVIAFKLNWIDTLIKLSIENDDFKMITSFYGMKSYEPNYNHNNKKLYIEDELESFITLIKAYYEKNYSAIDRYLKTLDILEMKDYNYRDKFLFLKVKRLIDIGNIIEASELYLSISNQQLKDVCELELKRKIIKGV